MENFTNGDVIKVGDIFTDGGEGRESIRLLNKAKVLYIDKYILVWFPLNDFTAHSSGYSSIKYKSNTWRLTSTPKKIELEELTLEELEKYNNSDSYLKIEE